MTPKALESKVELYSPKKSTISSKLSSATSLNDETVISAIFSHEILNEIENKWNWRNGVWEMNALIESAEWQSKLNKLGQLKH